LEDSSNSFYDNYEKFAFKSAPDEALFLRVLDRLKTLKEKHPTFTFIKTVSTHSPFINPDNKKSSEEKTFKYSDKEIGKFYSQLQKQNFFDDGIMIILGDHRKMATLLKEEVDKFGSINAKSQVPLILISKNKKPGIVTQQFQQVDIYNSLKNLISNESCSSPWMGDIMATNISPKYVAFKHSSQYYPVTIFEKIQNYQVHLEAEDSWVKSKNMPKEKIENEILGKIHSLRLK